MTNFIYDNTTLAYPKTDLNPIPPGGNPAQYFVASNWNDLAQAVVDLRDVIRSGKYHGFTEQSSDPAPSAYTSSYLWVRTSDKQLLHHRSDGTTRALADKSSDLLPDTDNTYGLGNASKRWASVYGTVLAASTYVQFSNGASAGVSASGTARLRYNNSSLQIQVSVNGGAYVSIIGSPITSKGDLLTHDGTDQIRLGVGTNTQVLTADNTAPSGLKWASAGTSSPLSTKGDIYVYSSVNTRQPVGSNGQVLSADSAQTTGLNWITLTSYTAPLTTKGDLFTRSSSADARLGVGTDGQILSSDSTQTTGLRWITTTTFTSPLSTKGDIYVRNASVDVRLAVGSDGQLLSADSTAATGLKWIAAPTTGIGGSLTIGRVPYASASTTISDTTLYWDNTNGRLGVGVSVPTVSLDVLGSALVSVSVALGGSGNASFFEWGAGQSAAVSGASTGRIRFNASTGKLQYSQATSAYADLSTLDVKDVKVSSGDTTPGYIFDKLVAGSAVSIIKNNAGGNETITLAHSASNFGATADKVTSVLRASVAESHTFATPKVVCQFPFNPQDYTLTNTTRSLKFRAVATNGDTGITTHCQLYNVTDSESIAILNFTAATPTVAETTLTIGASAGQVDDALKTYEVRIWVDSPDGTDDSIELGSAELAVINTIN